MVLVRKGTLLGREALEYKCDSSSRESRDYPLFSIFAGTPMPQTLLFGIKYFLTSCRLYQPDFYVELQILKLYRVLVTKLIRTEMNLYYYISIHIYRLIAG